MAETDETNLTEDAQDAIRVYVWLLFKRGATIFGIANLVALLVGYIYIVGHVSDEATAKVTTQAEARVAQASKVYEQLGGALSNQLLDAGKHLAEIDALKNKIAGAQQDTDKIAAKNAELRSTLDTAEKVTPETLAKLSQIAGLGSTDVRRLLDLGRLSVRLDELEKQTASLRGRLPFKVQLGSTTDLCGGEGSRVMKCFVETGSDGFSLATISDYSVSWPALAAFTCKPGTKDTRKGVFITVYFSITIGAGRGFYVTVYQPSRVRDTPVAIPG